MLRRTFGLLLVLVLVFIPVLGVENARAQASLFPCIAPQGNGLYTGFAQGTTVAGGPISSFVFFAFASDSNTTADVAFFHLFTQGGVAGQVQILFGRATIVDPSQCLFVVTFPAVGFSFVARAFPTSAGVRILFSSATDPLAQISGTLNTF